jgi:hypothetical protein
MATTSWLKGPVPEGFWDDPKNRKEYMNWLGRKLGFQKIENWYKITGSEFYHNKGGTLLVKHGGSPIEVLKANFPEYEWLPWKFKQSPQGFWQKKGNCRAYMKWLGEQLGFERPEDWYAISYHDFEENHGKGLLIRVYKGSPSAAAMDHFPKYDWEPWKFANLPLNFWKDRSHRQKYMKWLGRQLGFSRPKDWYKMTGNHLKQNFGGELLKYFDSSPARVVMNYLPNRKWVPWLFTMVPQGYWHKRKNRIRYIQWLGKRLGYRKPEDWYRISTNEFIENSGQGLLIGTYEGSAVKAVMDLVRGVRWKEWRFNSVPKKWWNEERNRKKYMRWLGKRLGCEKPEDWYKVRGTNFQRSYGGTLLGLYGGSPSAVVRAYYPDRKWLPWLFEEVPRHSWKERKNRRAYMKWLGDQMGFKKPSDWYFVRGSDFEENHGGGLYNGRYRSSPYAAVKDYLPRYPWKRELFIDTGMREKLLAQIVRRLFRGLKVMTQYKHPKMIFKGSGARMELDIYVPRRMIAFEYQGEQHFIVTPFWGGKVALKRQQQRDEEKRRACKRLGIRLIEVHYAWDGKLKSLKKMLENE